MLKAHVKINVSIHLEDEEPAGPEPVVTDRERATFKYPIQMHYAGTALILQKESGADIRGAIHNSVTEIFNVLNLKDATGTHKPDLALAKGGCDERGGN